MLLCQHETLCSKSVVFFVWKPLTYYHALLLSTLYEEVLPTKTTIYAPEKLSTLANRFIYTMEKINFGYSMKNMEIPQNKTYLLQLIEKIEMVIKRMRWKVLCNVKKETNGIKTEWYGLKSSKTPKQVKELIPFENDLTALVQSIRFRNTRNHFQKKIKKGVPLITSSDKTVTFADKTTNLYRLTKAEYDHVINNAITSKYKKTSNNIKKQINIDGKKILRNREVLNRLDINSENNSFITLKDHKENVNNNPTVRLINPAKNELGHISKAILDTANKNIREAMGLNQWRNTDTVIDWFKSIRNKHLCKFVVFDITEFYPSITANLLKKALTFAEAHTHLDKNMMTKQLFTTQENHCSLMISKPGLRETVGYSMSRWERTMERRFVSQLGIICFTSYQNYMIQCNLKIVDYLDVTFNLADSSYRLFNKTNNEINYIHKQSSALLPLLSSYLYL